MGRIAKNTKNSPIVKIGPVSITNKKVTGITYKTKGLAAMSMVVAYSLDNSTWSNLQTISGMPTSSTEKTVSNLNISGANFYLRFTVSVSTSTGSNRDFQLDDIVITLEDVPVDLTAFEFANVTPSVTLSKSSSTFDADYLQTVTVNPAAYDGTITYAFDTENSTFDVIKDAIIDDATGEITISTEANISSAQTILVKASATATSKYNKPSDATYTLTVNPAPAGVGTPTFSQATGSYYFGTTFTISSANSNQIYYTTDGSIPSKDNGTIYTDAIAINNTMTVKAIGYDGETASEIATIDYTLKAPEVPKFSVAAGGVAEGTNVELTMGDGGTKVVYTTDGTDPTANSIMYSSAITINYPTTIKAATVDDGNNLSSIETRAYTIVVAKAVSLWNENFSMYSKDDVPSGGTYSYSCSDGGSTTKIYTENLAGGTSPELLVSKTNGSFEATIPLSNIVGPLTLAYKANNNNLSVSVSSTTAGATVGAITYDNDAKTASLTISGVTKSMTSLTITFTNSKSSNTRIDNILLKYIKQFETEPIRVTSAGYATYVSSNKLDFTDKNIKAYIAKANGTTGVTFTQVKKVPANTGVLLAKSGGATENISQFDGAADDVTGNVFKAGTGTAIASVDAENNDLHNYILNNIDDIIGFYRAANQKVATNRAYIQIDESADVKEFISLPEFDDEETEIENLNVNEILNEAVYDLSGRRVVKPTKGLYIVNGKKYIKK